MARERRDREPTLGDERREVLASRRVLEQLGGPAVRAPGARHDLDRLAPGCGSGVERLLERAIGEERQEEPDLHAASSSSTRTGRRSSVERAIARIVARLLTLSAAVGFGLLAGGDGSPELGEDAAPVDPPQRRQLDPRRPLAMPPEPHHSEQGVVDAAGPGGTTALAEELPVAVPRRLGERLGPRPLVGDRRAVGEGEQGRDGGVVLERGVGHVPATGVDFGDLLSGDHPHQVDVVDRHVEEVRVRHLPAPVAAGDPRVAQVAAAGDPDSEQAPERACGDEIVERARLAPEAVVLRDHRDPPRARRGVCDRHGVWDSQRERLLDNDVTTGCERELGERPVRRRRRGEHDDVRLDRGKGTGEIAEGGDRERLLGPGARLGAGVGDADEAIAGCAGDVLGPGLAPEPHTDVDDAKPRHPHRSLATARYAS